MGDDRHKQAHPESPSLAQVMSGGNEDGSARASSVVLDIVSPEFLDVSLEGSLDGHGDDATKTPDTARTSQVTPPELDAADNGWGHARVSGLRQPVSNTSETEENNALEDRFPITHLTPPDSFMMDVLDFDSVLCGLEDSNPGLSSLLPDSLNRTTVPPEESVPAIQVIPRPSEQPFAPFRNHTSCSQHHLPHDCPSRIPAECDSHAYINTASRSPYHCMQNVLRLNEEVETQRSATRPIPVDQCLGFQKRVLRQCHDILGCVSCRGISAIAMLLMTICDCLHDYCQTMLAGLLDSFHHPFRQRLVTDLVSVAVNPLAGSSHSSSHGYDGRKGEPKLLIGEYCVDGLQEQTLLVSKAIELQLRELHFILLRLRDMAVSAGWTKHIARVHHMCAEIEEDIVGLRKSTDGILDELWGGQLSQELPA